MRKILIALMIFIGHNSFAQFTDNPCDAGSLTNDCGTNDVSLVGFTTSSIVTPANMNPSSNCGQPLLPDASAVLSADGWYTIVADANGEAQVYAAGSDPVVGLYTSPTNDCNNLVFQHCDDDGGAGVDALSFASGLTPGETVWVRVWDFWGIDRSYAVSGTSASGSGAPNDDCANAESLALNGVPVAGSGQCATLESGDPDDCEGNLGGNVWYTFTLPSTGDVDVNIDNVSCFGSGNGIDISLFTGTCGNFTAVNCRAAITSNFTASLPNLSAGTYTIMVDGDYYSGANSLCDFDIDVDFVSTEPPVPVCGTVGFHAEEAGSNNTITPFPTTMSCTDDLIYLAADDSLTAGQHIYPTIHFNFSTQNDGNDNVSIYIGGSSTLGSGTNVYSTALPNNTDQTVYGYYISTSDEFYFELCNVNSAQAVDWEVYDEATGVVHASGTASTGGSCQRFGPFSASGAATWATNAPQASVVVGDDGYMSFDPAIAGVGTYDFTYYWDDGVSCLDSATRSITVENPFALTSLSYNSPVCSGVGSELPTLVGDAGGTYASSNGLVINPTSGVIDVASSTFGTYTITYFLGDTLTACSAKVTAEIVIDRSYEAVDIVGAQICEDVVGGGSASGVDLTGLDNVVNGGTSDVVVWYDELLTAPISTPTNTTVNNDDVLSVVVGSGACADTAQVSYNVLSAIVLNDPNISLCEDTVGSNTVTGVDLGSYNTAVFIVGGTTPIYEWYRDAALTDQIVEPQLSNYTVEETLTDTIYVKVISGTCEEDRKVIININPQTVGSYSPDICFGETLEFNGTTYSSSNLSGVEVLNGTLNQYGCDSTVIVTVNALPQIAGSDSLTILCFGDSIVKNGTTYNASNFDGVEVYTAFNGCDSVVATYVEVLPRIETFYIDTICINDSVVINGTTYNSTNFSGLEVFSGVSANGCDSIVNVELSFTPLNTVSPDLVNPICFGETVSLSASVTGAGALTWYNDAEATSVLGVGNPLVVTPSSIGENTYYVVNDGDCPSLIDSVSFDVGGVTANILTNVESGVAPLAVVLDGSQSLGAVISYDWNVIGGGIPISSGVTSNVTLVDQGNYQIQLLVTDGLCSDSVTVSIDVFGISSLVVPNVFTPNDDVHNSTFTVVAHNIESLNCKIYNRWGKLVYEWNDVNGSWDGNSSSGAKLADGSYFYVINAKGEDGVEFVKKGSVTLLR